MTGPRFSVFRGGVGRSRVPLSMTNGRHLAALICGAILFAGAAGFLVAQTIAVPTDARVLVQKHANGSVEVAIEQGGERHLPRARFVSARAETGRWLRSSTVTILVDVPEPEPEVVERIVEAVVEPPVPLSVRPSDHEQSGLACLEQEDDQGNTWTLTDDSGDVSSAAKLEGVYTAGYWHGWATALALEGFPEDDWLTLLLNWAWHAQCASYHGVELGLDRDGATEPDDWMKEGVSDEG